MSNNIEWGKISEVDALLYEPGSFSDPFGNENDELAMAFGQGIVVEGTLQEWVEFATRLERVITAELQLKHAETLAAGTSQVTVDGVVVATVVRTELPGANEREI